MGTLTDAVISTTYKNLIFQKTDNKIYYTNGSDVDTEITTFASALTLSGLITATAGIQLGNNVIKASDGATAITTTATTGNVAINGDLTVTGNDIKSSSATAITMSGANVAIAGDLTITGGNITNAITCDSTLAVAGDLTVNGGDAIIKAANDDGASILMQADNSDDAGDDWKIRANSGQTFTIGNDIASAGSFVTLFTVTPHATASSSSVTIAGDLAISGGNITTALQCDSTLGVTGLTTLGGNLVIPNAGNIGSASDTDAISISSAGVITLTQNIVQSGSNNNTFASKVLLNGNTGSSAAAGIDASRTQMWTEKIGGMYKTSIYIDLAGLASINVDKDVIGLAVGGAAYIGKIESSKHGAIKAIQMTCLEVPVTGSLDIDLYNADEATYVYNDPLVSSSSTEYLIVDGDGNWANGDIKGGTTITFGATEYLYLVNGAASGAGTYGSGKFLIELYGT